MTEHFPSICLGVAITLAVCSGAMSDAGLNGTCIGMGLAAVLAVAASGIAERK